MYCEFYMDVFFVVNLLTDFLVLCLTNRILWGTANPLRALCGAFLGALGMCLICAAALEMEITGIKVFYFAVTLLMVRVGCSANTGKRLLMGTVTFFGAAFLMGGFLTVLSQETRKGIFRFSVITVTAYWILYIGIRLCKYLKGRDAVQCEVTLTLYHKKLKIKGLYDTGNCLYDPETGKPVCVMDYSCFAKLLDEEQEKALAGFCAMECTKSDGQHMDLLQPLKPRYVLYTSVGCEKGLLPVVTADMLTVEAGDKKKEVRKPAVGLSRTALCLEGNYQIIISPTFLDS